MLESTPLFTVRKPREAAIALITSCFGLAFAVAVFYSTTGRAAIEPVLLTLLGSCIITAVNLTCWYKSRKANAGEHRFILHRQERILDVVDELRGEIRGLRVLVEQADHKGCALQEGQNQIMAAICAVSGKLDALDDGDTGSTDWQSRAEAFQAELAGRVNGRNLHIVRSQ
ncbi:hypothetical protein AB0I28_12255 [Phytomonospora sp. NPDC050363]|uniref:hypothetical protein n=1 Tax=Phytomonospora sp. NPDC050363 TaxID=3155642 RepID=UPI0033E327D8